MRKDKPWPICRRAMNALWNCYGGAMEKTAQNYAVDKRVLGVLLAAYSFHPEPISDEILQRRNPYQSYAQRIKEALQQGLLRLDEYKLAHLTPDGSHAIKEIIQAAYKAMSETDVLRPTDLHHLAQILRKLVFACLEAPEPPGKWSINHSRRLDPGENANPLVRIDQYLSDLAAYRDDAHLAAWQPLGFDGPTWETLTLIYRKEAQSREELIQRLAFRDRPRQTYENAILSLLNANLITERRDILVATPKGEQVRQTAEEQTDTYFYAPWQVLSAEEEETLYHLCDMLATSLSP